MKALKNSILLLPGFFMACHSAQVKQPGGDTARNKQSAVQAPKPDFSNISFASKKDTSCGMPLSAGLEDTVQLDGKVYGFCSKECRNDFIAKLKTEKKR